MAGALDTRLVALMVRARHDLEAARATLAEITSAAIEVTAEAHRSGVPETVIAETVGVSRNTVRQWLAKHKEMKRDGKQDSNIDPQAE